MQSGGNTNHGLTKEITMKMYKTIGAKWAAEKAAAKKAAAKQNLKDTVGGVAIAMSIYWLYIILWACAQ